MRCRIFMINNLKPINIDSKMNYIDFIKELFKMKIYLSPGLDCPALTINTDNIAYVWEVLD